MVSMTSASSDAVVTAAFQDLDRACRRLTAAWSLVGGQALIHYGVPRETQDLDGLVESSKVEEVAIFLAEEFGWIPLHHVGEGAEGDYVPADEVVVHFMDDPVLFDIHEERRMIPLRSSLGLVVELLAAQHPVENEMIDLALLQTYHGVTIPLAPLGGVCLVKTKAARRKDIAAMEQVAEHLPSKVLREIVEWARSRDEGTAQDIEAIFNSVKVRLIPKRTKSYPFKRKP